MSRLNSSHRTIVILAVVAIVGIFAFNMAFRSEGKERSGAIAEGCGAVVGAALVGAFITRKHR